MMETAVEPQRGLLEQIRLSQMRARRWFRIQAALVWIAVIAGLVAMFAATDNVDVAWIVQWTPFILGGAGITILVCLSAIALATVLALAGALGRLSSQPTAYGLASLYVSLVRGTPLIVQIYIIYFSLPSVGIILDAIPAGIIALGFNYGAYMTEIFRAGIQAVPRHQTEAAEALGMPQRLLFRRIVLPQAVRIVTPAIGNEFIAMIKDSALVSIIGVNEVLWRAETSGRPRLNTLEAFIIAALLYWALTIIFSYFQQRLEQRMARSDR